MEKAKHIIEELENTIIGEIYYRIYTRRVSEKGRIIKQKTVRAYRVLSITKTHVYLKALHLENYRFNENVYTFARLYYKLGNNSNGKN